MANADVIALKERYNLIPACPEQLGGLPTPRTPAERLGERVIARNGDDVTDAYMRGAQATLALAKLFQCKLAVLKERSPSCGNSAIYDGTFSGTVIPGQGIAAELLQCHGMKIIGDTHAADL